MELKRENNKTRFTIKVSDSIKREKDLDEPFLQFQDVHIWAGGGTPASDIIGERFRVR